MKVILTERRAALAKDAQLNVEDVPEWQIKTPLQIAVQILKRHRDIYFKTIATPGTSDHRTVGRILSLRPYIEAQQQPIWLITGKEITGEVSVGFQ